MEKFTVEVTAKHIKKGVRHDGSSCPIALAIRSKVKSLKFIEVCSSAEFTKGRKHYVAALPKRAQTFIGKFDGNAKTKPFIFSLKPYQIDSEGNKVKAPRVKKTKVAVAA